ncbi:MAG TPA: L,D-transpeptidase [Bacteroidales bacterium]|nr:L,D-transpeptidase [Bacteroidales bacterium]HPR58288.1 L,D-transpeptidase [Bacteroidales bacterium]HRW96913.1 L,D-transpeptidase [Bacteroidales bacterium]
MKKPLNIFLIIAIILILAGTALMAIINMEPEPPVSEIKNAQQAINAARNARAEEYASDAFALSIKYYDSAMMIWNLENSKFFLNRDYSTVVRLANLSIKSANEAIIHSASSSKNLTSTIETKLNYLNNLIADLNTLSRFPLTAKFKDQVSKGKLALSEGKAAYDHNMLIEAEQKITIAEKLLVDVHASAFKNIRAYFSNFEKWKNWKEETIENSRHNRSIALIIDKFAGKCYVFRNGKQIHEFDAELGKNWIGDKRTKGDRATPEGQYKITEKKENGRTKYYKAMLIDYPNEDDQKRFKSELTNGTLPRNAKIGGLIEIHGHGGKGTDWTDGCVALTDKDIDKLFGMVKTGTPVTIIGSSINLDDIIKNQQNQ